MRQLAIQVLLIAGILAVAWRLLGSYGQRAQALRRIGLLAFAAFAVWSILDPGILTRIAQRLGIGRGADLVLYGLVLAFFGFVVTTFRRFREMEVRYTRLARRIALDEAPPATAHRNRVEDEPPPGASAPQDAADATPTTAAGTPTQATPEGAPPAGEPATPAPNAVRGAPEGGIRDTSPTSDVASATPHRGAEGLRTG